MERRSKPSLGAAVYDWIIESLNNGTYRPGDRLREEEIAERLKVSRTPVREALSRLQDRRFVDSVGGRGLIVRRLDLRDVMELYAMSEIVESGAARLAANHASEYEIETMREVNEAFAALGRQQAEGSETAQAGLKRLNLRFHDIIRASARNRYLDASLGELRETTELFGGTGFALPQRAAASVLEHEAIIDAVARRDAAGAEESARIHVRASLRAHLRLLQVG